MLIVKFRGLIDKIIQVLSTIIMGVMVIAVLNATRALYTRDLARKNEP